MLEKTIAAVTPHDQPIYPPFINATDMGDGRVRLTIRANPQPKDGIRICSFGPRDPNFRVGMSCWAGGEGCNNYCNMHPDRRTKERPDGIPMADHPESISYTQCGETLSAVFSAADWAKFVAEAAKL